MIINYDEKTGKFIIKCTFSENNIIVALPDRVFRKSTMAWHAPALKRNIQYMEKAMSNPQMYSERALQVFNQKRREYSEAKKVTSGYPSWYKFKNPPLTYQEDALKKFFPLNEVAIFFEQGLGKTYTSINLAAMWRITNQIEAVIVIFPSSILGVWESEIVEHSPIPAQVYSIGGMSKKNLEVGMGKKEDFQWLLVGVEGLSQGGAIEYVERFAAARKCAVIIDESSYIKTPNKVRTDRCIDTGRKVAKRVILSGTSITQGLEDLYTQYAFLNSDIIGYDSYYSYRSRYCIMHQIQVSQDKFIPKIIGYQNEDELMTAIMPYTLRIEKKDVLQLPPKVFTSRVVKMTPVQKKMYDAMKHELLSGLPEGFEISKVVDAFSKMDDVEVPSEGMGEIECGYEVKTVLEQMLRLQQITGGFYAVDNGERVKPEPIPGKNPKVEELMQVMEEISGKVVVWCQFRSEVELLAEAFLHKGIRHVEFHGGCDADTKKTATKNFRTDPSVKVFLATRAAARGLTLVEASVSIYYSQGHSLEQYSQSQDRIHRIGQMAEQCTYINLVCEKTVDVEVLKVLQGKQNVADMVYSLMKASN